MSTWGLGLDKEPTLAYFKKNIFEEKFPQSQL